MSHQFPAIALAEGTDADPPVGFAVLRLVMLPSGLSLRLTKPELFVGRHSRCDVRLPLPDVSRRHCRLWFEAGEWWLEDLGSMNGIYVNGERVQRRRLRPDDEVRVGGFAFVVNPTRLQLDVPRRAA